MSENSIRSPCMMDNTLGVKSVKEIVEAETGRDCGNYF